MQCVYADIAFCQQNEIITKYFAGASEMSSAILCRAGCYRYIRDAEIRHETLPADKPEIVSSVISCTTIERCAAGQGRHYSI